MPARFSVIIPLFNKRAYFARTLDRLLSQQYRDFEVIVVDDGSTDGSIDLLERYSDPRIRLIRQENAGPGPARNTGARHATGEWLALLDADDLWASDHLETLDRIIRACPEAGFISTQALVTSEITALESMPRGGAIQKIDYFADGGYYQINTSSVAFRRAVFDQTSGFGAFFPGEEVEFYVRIALQTPFAVCSDVTTIYLRDNDGIMEREERRSDIPKDRPVSMLEKTLLSVRDDERYQVHRSGIIRYLDYIKLRDARICLYNGNIKLARAQMAAMSRPMLYKTWMYRILSIIPPALVGSGIRGYSRIKHRINAIGAGSVPKKVN